MAATDSVFRKSGRDKQVVSGEINSMDTGDRMTMQEAEKEIECYKKIFDVVRLLSKESITKIKRCKESGSEDIECQCFAFWKRGYACENCISQKVLEDKIQRAKLEFMEEEIYQVTARYLEIDGEPYVLECIRHLDDDSLLDATGRNKLVHKLAHYDEELYLDALTGAYNRRYFEDRVKKTVLPSGVAVIDMDDFKLCNDTYGHNAGDAALEIMVQSISKCIRKTDTLIRYGGDEFLLIMPGIAEDLFLKKLQQIQKKIQSAVIPQYPKMQLSVSIGGVVTAQESMEEAVKRADRLMYQAKTQKNMVVTEKDAIIGMGQGKDIFTDRSKIRQQILIVDDSEINRMILTEILEEDFKIIEAENGEQALQLLQQYGTGISLVLLDIVMPVMDGFDVLNAMNQNQWIEDIPVIMISSEDSGAAVRRAYELGASDYINRPYDAKVVYQRVYNTIKLYAKQKRLITLVRNQIYEKERYSQVMISILSQIVEFRNGESGRHVMNINKLVAVLLHRLTVKTDRYHITAEDQELIITASALHDIGKIGIDGKILNKPGKLTPEEFEIMKTHTVIGASMLDSLEEYQDEKLVQIAKEICRWHHERYDGKGYPDGLVGDEIPISAQVVALADVYDALTSERVYKKAYSHEKAMKMILGGECGEFNPLLLECLVETQDFIRLSLEPASE